MNRSARAQAATAAGIALLAAGLVLLSCKPAGRTPPELAELLPRIGSAPAFTAIASERMTTARGDPLAVRSRWWYRKPHRLRMEGLPASEKDLKRLVVFDGAKTWMEIGNAVFVSDILPQHLWLLDGLEKNSLESFSAIRFLGRSTADGTEVETFEFTTKEAPLKRIQIAFGVADGIPRRIAGLNDKGSAEVEALLSNIKILPTLDDSLFSYAPPPGADVQELQR